MNIKQLEEVMRATGEFAWAKPLPDDAELLVCDETGLVIGKVGNADVRKAADGTRALYLWQVK